MTKRLVYGVGINDADYIVCKYERLTSGKQKLLWYCPIYKRWKHMLMRCYSKTFQNKCPSYIGVLVCKEWHLFSNFKMWMETQDWEDKVLDKDLLIKGNKEYSPQSCTFVSPLVNSFIVESTTTKGLYPTVVCFNKPMGKFQALCSQLNGKQKHLGYFFTPEEAYLSWKEEKLRLAKLLAADQKDHRVAQAILQRYEITD